MRPPHFSIFRVAKIFGADKPTTLLPHTKKVWRHIDVSWEQRKLLPGVGPPPGATEVAYTAYAGVG